MMDLNRREAGLNFCDHRSRVRTRARDVGGKGGRRSLQGLNTRQELFAQELAIGRPRVDAYRAAGYRGDRAAASRMSANVNVQRRVADLQSAAAARSELTIAGLTARLMAIADAGEAEGSAAGLNAARAALMAVATLNGLTLQVRRVVLLSPADRRARINDLAALRNRDFPMRMIKKAHRCFSTENLALLPDPSLTDDRIFGSGKKGARSSPAGRGSAR